MHCEVSHVSYPQGPVETLEFTCRYCSGAEHLLRAERAPFQIRGFHFVVCSYICVTSPGEILQQLFWFITHPRIRDTTSHLLEESFSHLYPLDKCSQNSLHPPLFHLKPNSHNHMGIHFCKLSLNKLSKHKIGAGLSLPFNQTYGHLPPLLSR